MTTKGQIAKRHHKYKRPSRISLLPMAELCVYNNILQGVSGLLISYILCVYTYRYYIDPSGLRICLLYERVFVMYIYVKSPEW